MELIHITLVDCYILLSWYSTHTFASQYFRLTLINSIHLFVDIWSVLWSRQGPSNAVYVDYCIYGIFKHYTKE